MDAVVVERPAGEQHGGVAVIRLNRPGTRNALTADVKAGLEAAIPELMADRGVGCLVITGTDGAFCAGGDLSAMDERDAASVRRRVAASHAWATLLLNGDKPVVAAVNGPAAGAGFSLAMLCDIVLIGDDAYLQAGFPAVGAVPDLGIALTLPRAIGMARARELLLTNRRVHAPEAVALGIAVRSHPPAELLAQAIDLAAKIAAGPRPSLGLTKLLLNRAYGSAEEFLRDEGLLQAIAFASGDFDEGVAAFRAKRRPAFGGRPGARIVK